MKFIKKFAMLPRKMIIKIVNHLRGVETNILPNRYTSGTLILPDFKFDFKVPDLVSATWTYNEIFNKNTYNFSSKNTDPFIIDCGVNIGLSVLYFKNLYPKANIIGFEPDPNIFSYAKENLNVSQLSGVSLINKAVWKEDTKLTFYSEGSDSGRSGVKIDNSDSILVDAVRLSDYITKTVDFLKIDIEGAEYVVLNEIADKLHLVDKIFIEYHSFVNQEQNLHSILSILNNNGFRYYLSEGAVCTKNPFMSIPTFLSMDMQINIYAFKPIL